MVLRFLKQTFRTAVTVDTKSDFKTCKHDDKNTKKMSSKINQSTDHTMMLNYCTTQLTVL